jgi:hypothetical protein
MLIVFVAPHIKKRICVIIYANNVDDWEPIEGLKISDDGIIIKT